MGVVTRTPYGEAIVALLLGWWGFWLLLPSSTFSSAPVYEPMRDLMAEGLWGLGFLMLALTHGLTFVRVYKRLRIVCLASEAAASTFISVMLYLGNPGGTGWGQYLILAIACVGMAARPTRAY